MSTYTPPALDSVNFGLVAFTPKVLTPNNVAVSSYSTPSLDAVNASLVLYSVAYLAEILFEIGLATQFLEYSRGSSASLPTDDAILRTVFDSLDITNVELTDAAWVGETGNAYVIHEFKKSLPNSTSNIGINWEGKSDVAPSTATVYLQIYNRNSFSWETLDSNAVAADDVNFVLSSTVSANVGDYYDGTNTISVRVYQYYV